MTIKSDTVPKDWVGCLIVVWTKDRRTIFRTENGVYSPILRPYVCNTIIVWIWLGMMTIKSDIIPLAGVGGLIVVFTIIPWRWFGIMTINPDFIPSAGLGCLIVVGTKDRRTIFRTENGGYSPILRPYACKLIIAERWLVMMTINSDTIRLAGVGCLIVVGTKDRRTIFRMENGGYSPILRPYAWNTIIPWRWLVMMTSIGRGGLFDCGIHNYSMKVVRHNDD